MCSCKTDDYFHLPIFLYSGEELVFSIEVHIPDVMEGKAAWTETLLHTKNIFFLICETEKEIS